MELLSKLFGARKGTGKHASEHAVTVHFLYGSTNFQHVYAVEDLLRTAISEAKIGEYDHHFTARDGHDGWYYMYGPDAEALYRVVQPVLENACFIPGATVTLWFGPPGRRTPKRVIEFPSQ